MMSWKKRGFRRSIGSKRADGCLLLYDKFFAMSLFDLTHGPTCKNSMTRIYMHVRAAVAVRFGQSSTIEGSVCPMTRPMNVLFAAAPYEACSPLCSPGCLAPGGRRVAGETTCGWV